MVCGKTAESSQRFSCGIEIACFDEVPRCLREVEEATSEDERPESLEDDWDAVAP